MEKVIYFSAFLPAFLAGVILYVLWTRGRNSRPPAKFSVIGLPLFVAAGAFAVYRMMRCLQETAYSAAGKWTIALSYLIFIGAAGFLCGKAASRYRWQDLRTRKVWGFLLHIGCVFLLLVLPYWITSLIP